MLLQKSKSHVLWIIKKIVKNVKKTYSQTMSPTHQTRTAYKKLVRSDAATKRSNPLTPSIHSGVNPFWGKGRNFIWRQNDTDSLTFVAPVFLLGKGVMAMAHRPWIDAIVIQVLVIYYYRRIEVYRFIPNMTSCSTGKRDVSSAGRRHLREMRRQPHGRKETHRCDSQCARQSLGDHWPVSLPTRKPITPQR